MCERPHVLYWTLFLVVLLTNPVLALHGLALGICKQSDFQTIDVSQINN